jgi:hypothetical protein
VIVLYPVVLLTAVLVVMNAPGDPKIGRGFSWFLSWAAAGALFTFSFLAAFSIGLFVLPFAAALLLWVAWRSSHGPERTGFAAGVGSVLLLIALLSHTGDGGNPTPWLAGGLAFTVVAVAAYALLGHTQRPV